MTALTVAVTAAPVAAEDATEYVWPDGAYHLVLSAVGRASGSKDDTAARGTITGSGAVDFTLEDGAAEAVPFTLTYAIDVVDVSQAGRSGRAGVQWTFSGTLQAQGGHVQLDPDTLSTALYGATFDGIDVGDVPLGTATMAPDIRFPLSAQAPVCGVASGYFEGTLDWLIDTARRIPSAGSVLDANTYLDSMYVALTPSLTDDPAAFADQIASIQADLTLISSDIVLAEAGEDLAEPLTRALRSVRSAEDLGATARVPECPSLDFYGFGIDAEIARILRAALGRDDLRSQDLWMLAELASRSGLSHASDEILSLRQAILEAGLAGDVGDLRLLITAAAAVGDWDVVSALTELYVAGGAA